MLTDDVNIPNDEDELAEVLPPVEPKVKPDEVELEDAVVALVTPENRLGVVDDATLACVEGVPNRGVLGVEVVATVLELGRDGWLDGVVADAVLDVPKEKAGAEEDSVDGVELVLPDEVEEAVVELTEGVVVTPNENVVDAANALVGETVRTNLRRMLPNLVHWKSGPVRY